MLGFFPVLAQAGVCEVKKSDIDINGLSLGKSILTIRTDHPRTFDIDYDVGRASIGYVDQKDFQDRFSKTPISSSGYITFDKQTKAIKEFSVGFDRLGDFSPEKYKAGVVALYSLPKANWTVLNSVEGNKSFNYNCDDYSIKIVHSVDRESFMVVKENSK